MLKLSAVEKLRQ
jgi:hypothetical protein